MNISIEKKKEEAVCRMKKIGIYAPTIRQFQRNDQISVSEPPLGAFFWADEEDMVRIRKFEQEYGALVYMIVRSYLRMDEDVFKMDSFLFVSDHEEEWTYDNADLDDGYALAYVYNHSEPMFSEIGTIGYELTVAGGLRRTT